MEKYVTLVLVVATFFVLLVLLSPPKNEHMTFYETSPLLRYYSGDFYDAPTEAELRPKMQQNIYDPEPGKAFMQFDPTNKVLSTDYYMPGLRNNVPSQVQFFSSASAYSPLPKIDTPQEKVGIIVPTDPTQKGIMNLYRQVIAPAQDLYQYTVQDKDGFLIRLPYNGFLDNGDTVGVIDGHPNVPSWTVKLYTQSSYVMTSV